MQIYTNKYVYKKACIFVVQAKTAKLFSYFLRRLCVSNVTARQQWINYHWRIGKAKSSCEQDEQKTIYFLFNVIAAITATFIVVYVLLNDLSNCVWNSAITCVQCKSR